MSLMSALVESIVSVIAGLLGFALLVGGGQLAAGGSSGSGILIFLIGMVLIVFAVKAGGS